MGVRLDHDGEALRTALVVLQEEEERESGRFLYARLRKGHEKVQQEGGCLQARKKDAHRNQTGQHLGPGLPSFQNCQK